MSDFFQIIDTFVGVGAERQNVWVVVVDTRESLFLEFFDGAFFVGGRVGETILSDL